MSSALQGWNILDTCKKNSCACLNLAGSTFVCILGNETEQVDSNLPLTLQIYENFTFALRTKIRDADIPGQEQTVFGTWKCCNGIWSGMAITGFSQIICNEDNIPDHYIRISLQICPVSNTVRWRRICFSADKDKCLSDKDQTITLVSPVFECKLQRVGNPCVTVDSDLKLPTTVF